VASIVIHPYDGRWPAHFAQWQLTLIRALGPHAKRVAHIGSTAVPGLAAKNIIDIQIGVERLSDEVVSGMAGHGFEFVAQHTSDHVPDGEPAAPEDWKKLYFRGIAERGRCHVHVRQLGCPNHRYALLFRDYLRAHTQARLTVERIKRELARLHADDADAYYAVKDPAYDLVWQAAGAWAARVGWSEEAASDP
jgi:GrpB-like predicted nucleotidyltransferase (UPF0157 family)